MTSYDAIDKAFADLQNQIDSGKLKDKYPQLEAVEEYAAKETWIPGLHTLNAPLACEYSSATELRNSDQLGLKYADSLKALLDGLASTIKFQFDLDPFQKHILFLFCGKRTDRIKGLVWEGDGFLLLYKRLNIGGFSWPRTKEEAMEITPEQFQMLMQGLSIVAKYPIKELKDPPKTM